MLQVVTFNIGGARGLRPAPHDHDKLAQDTVETLKQVINPGQPTVIALQETGLAFINGDSKNVGGKMADLLGRGYRHAFAQEVSMREHPHPNLWDRPAYRGMMHAAEGNAIVTNLAPCDWSWGTYESSISEKIFNSWSRHTPISRATIYSTGNRDTQPRNLMVASLKLNEVPIYVINTHLGLLIGEDRHDLSYERSQEASRIRGEQVDEILRVVEELQTADAFNEAPERPIILTGDFNAQPHSPEMDLLREVFILLTPENPDKDCWTHQTHRILIDHVLVYDPHNQLDMLSCHVQTQIPFNDLTDHRPLVAVFDVL